MVDASPTPSSGSSDSPSAPSIIDLCKVAVAAHPSWARQSPLLEVPYEIVETSVGTWSLGPSQRLIARQLIASRIFSLCALLIIGVFAFWFASQSNPVVKAMFYIVGIFFFVLMILVVIIRHVSFSRACRRERAAGPTCSYSRGQRTFQFPRVSDEWIDASRVSLYAISITHVIRYERPGKSVTSYSWWNGMCAIVDAGCGQPVCHVVLQTTTKRKRGRVLSAWEQTALPRIADLGQVRVEEWTNSPSAAGDIGD